MLTRKTQELLNGVESQTCCGRRVFVRNVMKPPVSSLAFFRLVHETDEVQKAVL